jgi:hypothetical protein
MAVEGGTDIGGRHLAVTDAAGLVSTLRTTTGSTVPCTYEFPETPTNVDAIVVTIDGAVIPRDTTGTNGWNVERDRFLEFYGTACSLLRDGNLAATYRKHRLPNYEVFDEERYFAAGEAPCVIAIISR